MLLSQIITLDKQSKIMNEHHEIAYKIIEKIRARAAKKENYLTAEILQNAIHKSSFLYLINRSVFYNEVGYTNYL